MKKKSLLRALIEANIREWNSFWFWRDKPIAERAVASEILQLAGLKVAGLKSRPGNQDPPDCEGLVDGQWSAIEVTELVHRKTLERSIKARRERAAGREPERPEAYFVWNRDDVVAAVQAKIDAKDGAKLKGGPYKRYLLVIHTNEFFLSRTSVADFLREAKFRSRFITDAFIGLSHEPGFGIPIFRLDLTRM